MVVDWVVWGERAAQRDPAGPSYAGPAPSEDMDVAVETPAAPEPVDVPAETVAEVPEAEAIAEAREAMQDVRIVEADVVHSLARTFQKAVPEGGDAVAAVYARLFWWDMDLRRDLQKGDRIAVAYLRPRAPGDRVGVRKRIMARRCTSRGTQRRRPLCVVLEQEGQETPRRLKDAPLNEYEQVTARSKTAASGHGL